MSRLLRALPLALALVLAPVASIARGQQQSNDVAQAGKVKSEIVKRGTGDKARVTIKLRNGSELKGRISETSDNMFILKEEKSGNQTEIAYSDVAKVKGRGLSKAAKFAVAVGVVAIAAIISLRNFDPFEHGVLR